MNTECVSMLRHYFTYKPAGDPIVVYSIYTQGLKLAMILKRELVHNGAQCKNTIKFHFQ